MASAVKLVRRYAKENSPRRSKSWPATEKEVELRDALATELISVSIGTLKKYGLSRRRLSTLTTNAISSDKIQIPVTTRVLSDMWRLGELGSKWEQDIDYLDQFGFPKALSIHGKGTTFQSLSREFFGRRPVEEVLALGCRTQVMQRSGANKVTYFGGCVMFTGNPELMLAYSIRTALWSLNTSVLNRRSRKQNLEALPDRTAFAVLSREDFPDFLKMMRSQISALIEIADRWLTMRSNKGKDAKGQKKAIIGIQALVFRDDAQ